MVALVATAKSTTANSYVTETDATEFLTEMRPYTTAWDTATAVEREKALMYATYVLDRSMEWRGSIRDIDQALRWPRSGVVDEDGRNLDFNTIPEVLERATAEFALSLLERNRVEDPTILGRGLKSASVGPLEVEVADGGGEILKLQRIPDNVLAMLRTLGDPLPGERRGGAYTVDVKR